MSYYHPSAPLSPWVALASPSDFVTEFPATSLRLWEAAGPTVYIISVTLVATHAILAWALAQDETGLRGHL